MTTKEQERQAIGKIRKIIEGLGENSYVGTAMEGVLEVAEQNIEFDAAFSLKARAEMAAKDVEELEKKNREQEEALKKLTEIIKKKENEEQMLRKEVERLQNSVKSLKLPEDVYKSLWEMTFDRAATVKEEMQALADRMANAALEEGAVNIKELAQKYQSARRSQEIYEHVLATLESKQEGERK